MPEITGTLENWRGVQIYTALYEYTLVGELHGDIRKRFPEGVEVRTSGINITDYPIDELKEGMVVKTRNSTYKLGAKQ